jgi:hypothetical protein
MLTRAAGLVAACLAAVVTAGDPRLVEGPMGSITIPFTMPCDGQATIAL